MYINFKGAIQEELKAKNMKSRLKYELRYDIFNLDKFKGNTILCGVWDGKGDCHPSTIKLAGQSLFQVYLPSPRYKLFAYYLPLFLKTNATAPSRASQLLIHYSKPYFRLNVWGSRKLLYPSHRKYFSFRSPLSPPLWIFHSTGPTLPRIIFPIIISVLVPPGKNISCCHFWQSQWSHSSGGILFWCSCGTKAEIFELPRATAD